MHKTSVLLNPETVAKATALNVIDLQNALLRFGHRPDSTIVEAAFVGLAAPMSFVYDIKTAYTEDGDNYIYSKLRIYVRAEETIVTHTVFFVADY